MWIGTAGPTTVAGRRGLCPVSTPSGAEPNSVRLCRLVSVHSRMPLGRADSRRKCNWRGQACWHSWRSAQRTPPSAQQTVRPLSFADRVPGGLILLGSGGPVGSRSPDPFHVARARPPACVWPLSCQAEESSWRAPFRPRPASLLRGSCACHRGGHCPSSLLPPSCAWFAAARLRAARRGAAGASLSTTLLLYRHNVARRRARR